MGTLFDEKFESYHFIGTILVFFGVYIKKNNVKKFKKFVINFSNNILIYFIIIVFLFLSKKFNLSP